MDSPPLWHSSPAASSGPATREDRETTAKEGERKHSEIGQIRSFSCIQTGGRKTAKRGEERGGDGDGEERMDLLWENFNEDLARSRSSRFENDDRQIVEIGCNVQAVKKSRTSRNGGGHNNKPAMVMVLKVLKKLFLTHSHSNSHHHHHHHHRHHNHNKLRASSAW